MLSLLSLIPLSPAFGMNNNHDEKLLLLKDAATSNRTKRQQSVNMLIDLMIKNDKDGESILYNLVESNDRIERQTAYDVLVQLLDKNKIGEKIIKNFAISSGKKRREMAFNLFINLILKNNKNGEKMIIELLQEGNLIGKKTVKEILIILIANNKIKKNRGYEILIQLTAHQQYFASEVLINLIHDDIIEGIEILYASIDSSNLKAQKTAEATIIDLILENNKTGIELLKKLTTSLNNYNKKSVALEVLFFLISNDNKTGLEILNKLATSSDITQRNLALSIVTNLNLENNKTGLEILVKLTKSSDENEQFVAYNSLAYLIKENNKNALQIFNQLTKSTNPDEYCVAYETLYLLFTSNDTQGLQFLDNITEESSHAQINTAITTMAGILEKPLIDEKIKNLARTYLKKITYINNKKILLSFKNSTQMKSDEEIVTSSKNVDSKEYLEAFCRLALNGNPEVIKAIQGEINDKIEKDGFFPIGKQLGVILNEDENPSNSKDFQKFFDRDLKTLQITITNEGTLKLISNNAFSLKN